MSLSIYLYFDGCCREAFEHYKAVFGAAEICCQTFEEGPPEMFADQPADRIMHTTIQIGDSVLMGSDRDANCDDPITQGNNYSITYRPASPDEADRLLPLLADGGEITMPLQRTFWGSYFGLCTDKFGIHWMFNCAISSADQ